MKVVSRITAFLCLFFCLFMPLAFAEDDIVTAPGTGQDATMDQEPTEPEPSLPAKYDLRNVDGRNYVTPIKSQGSLGTCWAHACIGAAESNAIMNGANPSINLSEKALAWYAFQLEGSKEMTPEEYEGLTLTDIDLSWQYDPSSRIYNTGGQMYTGIAQMQTWLGACTEAQVPYCNSNNDYEILIGGPVGDPNGDWSLNYDHLYDNAYHLQNAEVLCGPATKRTTQEEFTPKAKELLLKYGALRLDYKAQKAESQFYNETNAAQYINELIPLSHSVLIVGWDDDYPASNFNITPPGDGAWIVKNSWGIDYGDQGYFYLSYYDQTINNVAGFNVETEETGYSYDKNNQYDFTNLRGANPVDPTYTDLNIAEALDFGSIPAGNLKMANVFTAESDQVLRAVSAFPALNNASTVTVDVYLLQPGATNPEQGTLQASLTKDFENGGFYTIELPEPIELPKGTSYSVVESITYYDVSYTENDTDQPQKPVMPTMQDLAVEYGFEEPLIINLFDSTGEIVGLASEDYVVHVDPGQSYVYGLNGTIGVTPPEWVDITNAEIKDKLSLTRTYEGPSEEERPCTTVPGNVMIKAYTTYGIGDDIINPTSMAVNKSEFHLTTLEGDGNSRYESISVVIEPSNTTTDVTWSVTPENVVSFVDSGALDKNARFLKAENEGVATVTATSGNGLVATATVYVSNDDLISDGLDIIDYTPDRFSVMLENVRANPAIADALSPQRVSLFAWSAPDQSDINAKLMHQVPGTSDWIYEGVPVNDNSVNNYFIDANDIKINVYASTNPNNDGRLMQVGTYDWLNPGILNSPNVAYISYCQNTGFVKPTVWDGTTSGNLLDPYSQHLEGFRISSGLEGIEISSTAYAQGLGWLPEVDDGVYCGTMEQNRPLEAIKLNLEEAVPNLSLLTDFRYRVFTKESGWSDWVSNNGIAGQGGSGQAIQAVQVVLNPLI